MNLFLDTAALVKLYHKESGTADLSNFLREQSSDLILTISDLAHIRVPFRDIEKSKNGRN